MGLPSARSLAVNPAPEHGRHLAPRPKKQLRIVTIAPATHFTGVRLGQAALHGSLRKADVGGLPGADSAASFVEKAFEIGEADSP